MMLPGILIANPRLYVSQICFGGTQMLSPHIGMLNVDGVEFNNVLVVPGLRCPIISESEQDRVGQVIVTQNGPKTDF